MYHFTIEQQQAEFNEFHNWEDIYLGTTEKLK